MTKNNVKPIKPLVFIGSSKEGLDILNAIVSNLQYECEFVTWDVGVFGASEYPLESLVNARRKQAGFCHLCFVGRGPIGKQGRPIPNPKG